MHIYIATDTNCKYLHQFNNDHINLKYILFSYHLRPFPFFKGSIVTNLKYLNLYFETIKPKYKGDKWGKNCYYYINYTHCVLI